MGMRLRKVQTTTKVVDGKTVVVPQLDDKGQEIELWSIEIPQEIEHHGGIPPEIERQGKDAIGTYIAQELERLHPPSTDEGEE